MKITGGNVGAVNASISAGGAIVAGDRYFRACDVRDVRLLDRESKTSLWNAAGNVMLGDYLAGTPGAVVGAMVTKPVETLTIAVLLWPNETIVGHATHAEFQSLAGAAAANFGREPPALPRQSLEEMEEELAKIRAGEENAGELIAALDERYDRRLHMRRARRIADLPMLLVVMAAVAGVGYLCYGIWTALQH